MYRFNNHTLPFIACMLSHVLFGASHKDLTVHSQLDGGIALPEEAALFDQMAKYKAAINKRDETNPIEAINVCVKLGPQRSTELLRKIIIAYPEYHDGLLRYLKQPELHKINYAFPLDPVVHQADEASGIQFIALMAQQGHHPSRQHYDNYCAQIKAEEAQRLKEERAFEAEQKRAEQKRAAQEKRKQRAAALQKQQEEKDQAAYARACRLLKQKKFTHADNILAQLAKRGNINALAKRGRILEKFMQQEMQKQIEQNKVITLAPLNKYYEQAISLYMAAGAQECAHGYWRLARMFEFLSIFFEKQHTKLCQLAQDRAKDVQPKTLTGLFALTKPDKSPLLDEAIATQKELFSVWKCTTGSIDFRKADQLEAQTLSLLEKFSKANRLGFYTQLVLFQNQLGTHKSNYFKLQAKQAYAKAIEIDPEHAKALTYLAVTYANEDDIDQGIELLKRACIANPDHQNAFNALHQMCHQLLKSIEKRAQAEDLIAFMEASGGASQFTWDLRAKCAIMNADEPEALACYIKAGKCRSAPSWYYAGIISQKHGDLQSAKTYYKKACSLDKTYVPALIELGDIYLSLGKDSKAFRTYLKTAESSNARGLEKIAQCMHFGIGHPHDIATASILYEKAAQCATQFSDKRNYEILAQITKLQDPRCLQRLSQKERLAIQNMVKRFCNRPQIPGDTIANRYIAEAHFAKANLHSICARKSQIERDSYIEKNEVRLGQLDKSSPEYHKMREDVSAHTKKMKSRVDLNYLQAIQELKAAECGIYDFRSQFMHAQILQQHFFPHKKLTEMEQNEPTFCARAKELYQTIIKECAQKYPDSFFLLHARRNLCSMYRHLNPEDAIQRAKTIFSIGTKEGSYRCFLNLAAAAELGLLSINGKPDYALAMEHIRQAAQIKLGQRTRKELAFYRYATKTSMSTLEQEFIEKVEKNCRELYQKELLKLPIIKRLIVYAGINFTDEGIAVITLDSIKPSGAMHHRAASSSAAASSSSAAASSSSSARSSASTKAFKVTKGRRRRR